MNMFKEEIDMGEVSDGYHTFNELYEFRKLYNAALFNEFAEKGLYDVHKSKKHSDGSIPFGNPDYFIVVAELPTGQISNHYRMKDWRLFNIPEKEYSNDYDGHTPEDVTNRLREFLTKSSYPKNYEECCKVLGFYSNIPITMRGITEEEEVFSKLIMLKRCRDAYWKIAGEEMGLSGSWEPDFASCKIKYAITYYNNVVSRYSEVDYNSTILVFPTEEMCDIFYEAFKELIEECKVFL